MSGDGERRKRVPSITSLVAFAMIVLTLYVLSPGPLTALADAGYISEEGVSGTVLRVVYWPLHWCYENFDWFETLYEWYVSLWTD